MPKVRDMKPGDKVRVQLTPDGGYFDAALEQVASERVWRVRIGQQAHLIREKEIHGDAD